MKKLAQPVFVGLCLAFAFACGSSALPPDVSDDPSASADGTTKGDDKGTKGDTPGGGDTSSLGSPKACPNTKERCGNGEDEDCDGLVDCQDPDCSGIGTCPVCGQVEHPEAKPLALPDGVEDDDGDVIPYESKLTFTGFGANQTLTKASDIIKVCVNMEHTWLRDLEIKLISPSGKAVILDDFRGRTGNQVLMGKPNGDDDSDNPVPGVGAEYCWATNAPNGTMLDYADTHSPPNPIPFFPAGTLELPSGSYKPAQPFDGFIGTPLNGDWTIHVTDLWSNDNGFIFGWSIAFDPSLVQDCSVPLVK